MKRCSHCRTLLPHDAFPRNRHSSDGLGHWCKRCQYRSNAEYQARHPERVRAIKDASYRRRQTSGRVIQAHREAQRRFRETHRERLLAEAAAWREQNRERTRETAREWSKAHPQYHADSQARRRARLLGNGVEVVDRHAIYERDRGRCHICQGPVPERTMTLDHLIPVSQAGPHAEWNVAVAHRSCNSRRGPGRIPAQLRLL